jgi:hypothetical protein
MRRAILVSLFCVAVCIRGYSQSKEELVRELFRVMQVDAMTDKMFESIIPGMINQMPSPLPDSIRAKLDQVMASQMQVSKSIMKRMRDEDMVPLYVKYYTQTEINDLLRFYKSPSGQKFIKNMPEIQKEVMTIMMQKYMPEIQRSMMEKMKEILPPTKR